MQIRLLLIDDFPLIRSGFAAALETDPGIQIVGQADDGDEGLRLAQELRPDVVVLDLLRLVPGGYTDREIASQLYISPRTVQNHRTRIREKTGLRRRAELTRWAMEHALT